MFIVRHVFSYIFSSVTSKCAQNAPFWCKFPKTSQGRPPGPRPAGGGDHLPTLPLSALRASVKPSASLVTSAPPAMEVLDPPCSDIWVGKSKVSKKLKCNAKIMQKTSWFQKGLCNKPHKSQLKSILNIENVYAINTLRIHRSRLKNLASCARSELWSISSDTYQVIGIQKKRLLLR